ncbi:MAG TPA: hypothetical protein VFY75_09720 [Solirubrobacterales bacterium]|nr:hypothetical protein [Solirubrobacterales bacterium]
MSPWKLPLVVAAIAVPIALAFLLVGPAAGLPVGALVAVAIVLVAVRQRPRGAISPVPGATPAQRILIVAAVPLEDPAAIEEIAAMVESERSQVMVLAPAKIGFLDRWASDVETARSDAQRRLVVSLAALAAAGIQAEARVGDEDVVQAVEDQLGSYPATDVILVSADDGETKAATAAAEELRSRLRAGFRWIVTGPAGR